MFNLDDVRLSDDELRVYQQRRVPPARGGAVAELQTAVAALTARVAVLEQDRRQEPPGNRLRRADRARLARLLPAIAGALGSEPFTVAELFEHAAVRLVLDGSSENRSEPGRRAQVGRLLERAIGLPVDGYVVARVGTELHRRLWTVTAAV